MKSLFIHLFFLSLCFAIVIVHCVRGEARKTAAKITPVIVDRYDSCQSLREPNMEGEKNAGLPICAYMRNIRLEKQSIQFC